MKIANNNFVSNVFLSKMKMNIFVFFTIAFQLFVLAFLCGNYYSLFNSNYSKMTTKMHSEMLQFGHEFISSNKSLISFYNGSDPDLSLVIISTQRKVPYIHSLVASIVTATRYSKSKVSLEIINIKTVNPDLDLLRSINGLIIDDNVTISDDIFVNVQYPGYIRALSACQRRNAISCIVFEEDAVLSKQSISIWRDFEPKSNDYIVKLFTTDSFNGFQLPVQDLITSLFLPTGLITLIIVLIISLFYTRKKLILMSLVIYLNLLIAYVFIGRQQVNHWLSPSFKLVSDAAMSSISNVAVAYSKNIVTLLKNHMSSVYQARIIGKRLNPVDIEVVEFLRENGIKVQSIIPSIAQHIGAYSSKNAHANFEMMLIDSFFEPNF